MRLRLLIGLLLIAFTTAACQEQPPTVMVLVVTFTPDVADSSSGAASIQPQATATAAPTPTFAPFPTPVVGQVQVAEQPFERGRMFWVQPKRQIWVLMEDPDDPQRGTWRIYDDTFTENDPALDPDITPPDEGLYQPERGFGKLWRENEAVRSALGWAVTPEEFGYISNYEYHLEPIVTANGQTVPGPAGYHILFSLYEVPYRFNERDGTWQEGRGDD